MVGSPSAQQQRRHAAVGVALPIRQENDAQADHQQGHNAEKHQRSAATPLLLVIDLVVLDVGIEIVFRILVPVTIPVRHQRISSVGSTPRIPKPAATTCAAANQCESGKR